MPAKYANEKDLIKLTDETKETIQRLKTEGHLFFKNEKTGNILRLNRRPGGSCFISIHMKKGLIYTDI